ncbi:MAG: Nif3-like dinuclear metal center hexameric protein [Bacillota bacterium]
MRLAELQKALDEAFPPHWAAAWDNVGLTIGRADAEVRRIFVALDVTAETVAEAVERRCELLVTHHPFPWHERRRYDLAAPEGRLLAEVVRTGLNLLAVHTNLDAAPDGHAVFLAHRLGLADLRPLKPTGDRLVKIVVFVPRGEDAARVRTALAEAGAGKIGRYRGCSFTTAGTGRFIPEEGAHPAIGRIGQEEAVEEERVEAICQARLVDRVL